MGNFSAKKGKVKKPNNSKKDKKNNNTMENKENFSYLKTKEKIFEKIEIKKSFNNFNTFQEPPIKLHFLKNIINDSFSKYLLDNSFIVFKSLDNLIYLIYSNEKNSIISFDLISNKKINEIKNAHFENIKGFRYYLDKNNKRDLIISISGNDNNIKLWNINNFECLLNLRYINKIGFINSACFLNNNNEIYIVTSGSIYPGTPEPVKIFNLNGQKIKEINDLNDCTYFIDSYYDKKLLKNYIITGNKEFNKSYDYNNNNFYHKYFDKNCTYHYSLTIINNNEEILLIGPNLDNNIRIWNFHSGLLLKKINCYNPLFGVCLWDNDHFFVGCEDKTIKIIEIKTGKIIETLTGHNESISTIKKIIHPKYGECLISKGLYNEPLKLWIK